MQMLTKVVIHGCNFNNLKYIKFSYSASFKSTIKNSLQFTETYLLDNLYTTNIVILSSQIKEKHRLSLVLTLTL